MYSLQIGQRIDPNRTSFPETTQLRLFEEFAELAIFMSNPTDEEKADVTDGSLQFAVVDATPHLMIFGYKLGSQIWCDAPFEAHRVAHDLEDFAAAVGDTLPLRVLLVNSDTGILESWRFGEFPTDFSDSLRAAMRGQLAAPYDPDTAGALLNHLYTAFPTPEGLFKEFAIASCRVP